MGHTENRIEYHGRPEQTADQLPRRNAEYAADMPFAEKQHGDPKNQRTAEERKETPLQYAHGAAQLRVDRRLEPEQKARRNHHAQIKNLFHSPLHCVLFPPAA